MPTVRQRGENFQAIVRVKQHGVLVHTESKTFPTEALATDWGLRLEKKIKEQGVPARQRQRLTFGELIQKYRTVREETKPIGRAMLGDLDMLYTHLGQVSLDALDANTFSDFARKRRKGTAGPATVLHNLAIARTVLNAAKPMFNIDIRGDVVGDAIKSLQLTGHVAKSRSRDRRPTAAELDALDLDFKRVAQFPSTKLPMDIIVRLGVAFPRRISELCDMLWVDYDGKIVTLRDTKHPRNPRTEKVPVPPEARKIIDSLPRIDARILPYKSESCSAAFDRACERLNIVDLHLHDLRHEGICRLFERGLQIQEVAMISGHTSWTTLRRYTHLRPESVLEKMDARSS